MPTYWTAYGLTFGLMFSFYLVCAVATYKSGDDVPWFSGIFGCAFLSAPLACLPYFAVKMLAGLAAG